MSPINQTHNHIQNSSKLSIEREIDKNQTKQITITDLKVSE